MVTSDITLPIQAATEILVAHGVVPDRCEILQQANTLVIRLTESLVARIVLDPDGPRQGTAWFERENAVAQHLASLGAPVIPMHPAIPSGPYFHKGYPINFWKFVIRIESEPEPEEMGKTLFQCHQLLRSFRGSLQELAIPRESLELLPELERKQSFPSSTIQLLRDRLTSSLEHLEKFPMQPLHGDAHPGNLMNTSSGLLWTDWEDTFLGPVEWDLASVLWNAKLLDHDTDMVDGVLRGYLNAGGVIDETALEQCFIARAAVMTAWYPILYPNLCGERKAKLESRVEWLRNC